jgi:hypothetical protein
MEKNFAGEMGKNLTACLAPAFLNGMIKWCGDLRSGLKLCSGLRPLNLDLRQEVS